MLYALKVNFALANLGIDTRWIRDEYRQGAQAVGKASGNSPQEVAVFIASQLPIVYQLELDPAVAKKWVRERKINPRDPEMRTALVALNWGELIEY